MLKTATCIIILFLSLNTLNNKSFALNEKPIRLAILDNIEFNSFSQNTTYSESLKTSYKRGIETAISSAHQENINIEVNYFLYGNSLPDMANKIPDLKEWQPDVIIGLNDTNHFLMARNYFTDIMVISLFATDYKLKSLPNNFHSMVIPDENIAEVFPAFVKEKFPNRNIFLAIAADSKESEDMSYLVKNVVGKKFPSISLSESEFIQDEMPTLNLSSFLKNYRKDDVILLLCTNYYSGAEFMSRISKYLYPYKPTFIVDFDNWGNNSVPTTNLYPFFSYRITPYIFHPETDEYHHFYSTYVKLFNEPPQNQISFQTYKAVRVVVLNLFFIILKIWIRII